MKSSEIAKFQMDESDLATEDYMLLEYYFETIDDPLHSAACLCQEMSTAQWHRVGVDEDFRPKFGAKVVEIKDVQKLEKPSNPQLAMRIGWDGKPLKSCKVRIAYPIINIGPRIPNLLTVLGGEGVFHAPYLCAIRLEDIYPSNSFLKAFQGPQFGVKGIRDMLAVYDRPLFFGVIKPNVGLAPKPFAELAYQAWLGGLDIAMDDELLADTDYSPLEERSQILGELRKKAEQKTGKKKIYLANITDEVDQLQKNQDIVVRNGANAIMLNTLTVGISAVRALRKFCEVPIVSHFDLYGGLTQISYHGIRESVFIKLLRLAGVDVVLFPGFDARMKSTEADVLSNVEACRHEMGGFKPMLPLPAGSQWAGSLEPLYSRLGSIDFGIVPGRGVFAHPMGPAGGARSLIQAWEAIEKGSSIIDHAKNHVELQSAIETKQSKL